LGNKACVDFTGPKPWMSQNLEVQWYRGFNAFKLELGKRSNHSIYGLLPVDAP
jgi:hypothetical protein